MNLSLHDKQVVLARAYRRAVRCQLLSFAVLAHDIDILLQVLVSVWEELSVVEPVEELGEFHHGLLFEHPLVMEGLEYLEVPKVKDLEQ